MFILVWFEISFLPAQVPLKLMQSNRYKGPVSTQAFTGRFRGEWVNSYNGLEYIAAQGLFRSRCKLSPTKMPSS